VVEGTLEDKIRYALRGYQPAVDFFFLIRDVLHFWDDLIDKDKPVSNDYINRSMFSAVIRLPSNPFFRQYQDTLLPIMVNAVANWQTANQFEAEDDTRRLQIAYVIRSDYANILIQLAYLVGGYDWMVEVTPMIRDMWTNEDFEMYMLHLGQEIAARG